MGSMQSASKTIYSEDTFFSNVEFAFKGKGVARLMSREMHTGTIISLNDSTVSNIDFKKKQKYLDSIWNKPVYNLVSDFTFKDIKESELNLGLDLQGGMHVTLEVSPVDILVGLSSNSQDPDFLQAISQARENIKGTQLDFISEFYSEFNTIAPQKNLAQIFATVSNRGRIGFDSSDSEILDIINEEVESAIDRSFNILRTRIDRFGTSQPNIQRLQGTGRIQIELPGVDNPERVRKLLQGVAKLEFWEVSELNETEVSQTIQIIDQFAVSQNILNNNLSEENTEIDNTSQSDDIESLLSGNTENTENTESDDDTEDNQLNNSSSPLLSNLRSEFGGLFYNLEDTMSINTILSDDKVQQLIPNTIKFLWAPLIDNFKIPILYKIVGHRKSWLFVIQFFLIISIFLLGFSDPAQNIKLTAFFALF